MKVGLESAFSRKPFLKLPIPNDPVYSVVSGLVIPLILKLK